MTERFVLGVLQRIADFFSPSVETRSVEPVIPSIQIDYSVGAGEALTLPTVYRATQIITVAVKQLSIKTYRGDEEIDAPQWIRRPDINMSRSAFVEMTTTSLVLTGNAFWYITRDNQNRVTNLEVLNPLDVVIETNDWGKPLSYSYKGSNYNADEIKHLAVGRVPGHSKGQGPIQKAQVDLRGALDLQAYSGHWFTDGGVPTGVLKSDQVLSPEAAQQYKDAWNQSQGATRGVAVLGQGLNYSPVYLSPTDAQFIENQKFSVTQIARLFGISARLLLASVEGGSMTYANLESEEIVFMRYTLMNYVTEIEDSLSMLLPGRTEAKFNVEALLRPDTLTRYQSYEIAVRSKFHTVDEIRAIENLAPLTKEQKEELGVGQPQGPVKEAPQDDTEL